MPAQRSIFEFSNDKATAHEAINLDAPTTRAMMVKPCTVLTTDVTRLRWLHSIQLLVCFAPSIAHGRDFGSISANVCTPKYRVCFRQPTLKGGVAQPM